MNLYGLDLNLLVAFDALMLERNVTRAAERIGLTQPAMSNVLRRIRDMLEDEVLVRQGRAMVPTPRALELEKPIRQALESVQQALAPRAPFDPAESKAVFWLGGRDYMEVTLMPRLVARVGAYAPRVDLRVRNIHTTPVVAALEEGRFDLAIGFFDFLRDHLRHEVLFEDMYVTIARADHPLVRGGSISLDAFVQASHVLPAPFGGDVGVVDSALAEHGLGRRVSMSVAHFGAVPLVVARTDLIACISICVARSFVDAGLPIDIIEPPIRLPRMPIEMVWHERTHTAPGHAWLRDQIRIVAEAVLGGGVD